MGKWGYVGMLASTVAGSFWLEIVFKVRVLKRITRALRAIAPIAIAFLIWDALAIKHGDWFFDSKQILGIFGPFRIPLEEYFFFLVVPLAAIMTIEAVRRVKGEKPGWLIGDEE
jgi:lycopene cyclase domain-containing protein